MKNILFFSYLFPPRGGSGVQRSYSFVKYLPQYGFNPIVVTSEPEENHLSEVNTSLLNDLLNTTIFTIPIKPIDILKKSIFEAKLFRKLPLKQTNVRWWLTSAIAICEKIIKENKIELIYITASPFSAPEIGTVLSKKFHLPWVLDLRDAWAIDDISVYTTYLHYLQEFISMKNACKSATAVIMNTPSAKLELKLRFPFLDKKKIFSITNGFDEEIISKPFLKNERHHKKPFQITYCGQFYTDLAFEAYSSYRKKYGAVSKNPVYFLKRFIKYSPGSPNLLCRSPYYFLKAIKELIKENKIDENTVVINLVGNVSKYDLLLLEDLGLENVVNVIGYVSYKKTMEYYSEADALLLTQHKPKKSKRILSIPGKTYDLMKFGKIIFALVPEGDAKDILMKSGLSVVCEPDDIHSIKKGLADMLLLHSKKNRNALKPNWEFINKFNRKNLSETLSNVFRYAIKKHPLNENINN